MTMFINAIFVAALACAVFLPRNADSSQMPNSDWGPRFMIEPTMKSVGYFLTQNLSVECFAEGNPDPVTQWVRHPNEIVNNFRSSLIRAAGGKRNTLKFLAVDANQYDKAYHDAFYSCVSKSKSGKVSTLPIKFKAVVNSTYKVETKTEGTIFGGVAELRCLVDENVKEFVNIESWTISSPGKGSTKVTPIREDGNTTAKMVMCPRTKNLYVINVDLNDLRSKYRCDTVFVLNGKSISSDNMTIKANYTKANVAPFRQQKADKIEEIIVYEDLPIVMFCPINGVPKPYIRWIHEANGERKILFDSENIKFGSNSYWIMIKNAAFTDSGLYYCQGMNADGEDEIHFQVFVTVQLQAAIIQPFKIMQGETVKLRCNAPENSGDIKIQWLKNMVPLEGKNSPILTVDNFRWKSGGIYACQVYNSRTMETVQAWTDVRITVIQLAIASSFSEGNVKAGRPIYLSCMVYGRPAPNITWYKDGEPVRNVKVTHHKNDYTEGIVNIAQATTADDGIYKCTAQNDFSIVEHSARISVEGPTVIDPSHRVVYEFSITTIQLVCDFFMCGSQSAEWYTTASAHIRILHSDFQHYIMLPFHFIMTVLLIRFIASYNGVTEFFHRLIRRYIMGEENLYNEYVMNDIPPRYDELEVNDLPPYESVNPPFIQMDPPPQYTRFDQPHEEVQAAQSAGANDIIYSTNHEEAQGAQSAIDCTSSDGDGTGSQLEKCQTSDTRGEQNEE